MFFFLNKKKVYTRLTPDNGISNREILLSTAALPKCCQGHMHLTCAVTIELVIHICVYSSNFVIIEFIDTA